MTDFTAVKQNLERLGYTVSCFPTAAEAAAYLDKQIDGASVGIGGSMTVEQMGLYDRLCTHNEVFWHWKSPDALEKAARGDVYLSSVNGLAESGEIVNIDGNGNRVAATFFGHKKVYLIVGENKLAKDYDAALWRARNIASPKNAKRLSKKTPCAAKADRCYNCDSPERICRGLCVFWEAPMMAEYEVVLVGEPLGY